MPKITTSTVRPIINEFAGEIKFSQLGNDVEYKVYNSDVESGVYVENEPSWIRVSQTETPEAQPRFFQNIKADPNRGGKSKMDISSVPMNLDVYADGAKNRNVISNLGGELRVSISNINSVIKEIQNPTANSGTRSANIITYFLTPSDATVKRNEKNYFGVSGIINSIDQRSGNMYAKPETTVKVTIKESSDEVYNESYTIDYSNYTDNTYDFIYNVNSNLAKIDKNEECSYSLSTHKISDISKEINLNIINNVLSDSAEKTFYIAVSHDIPFKSEIDFPDRDDYTTELSLTEVTQERGVYEAPLYKWGTNYDGAYEITGAGNDYIFNPAVKSYQWVSELINNGSGYANINQSGNYVYSGQCLLSANIKFNMPPSSLERGPFNISLGIENYPDLTPKCSNNVFYQAIKTSKKGRNDWRDITWTVTNIYKSSPDVEFTVQGKSPSTNAAGEPYVTITGSDTCLIQLIGDPSKISEVTAPAMSNITIPHESREYLIISNTKNWANITFENDRSGNARFTVDLSVQDEIGEITGRAPYTDKITSIKPISISVSGGFGTIYNENYVLTFSGSDEFARYWSYRWDTVYNRLYIIPPIASSLSNSLANRLCINGSTVDVKITYSLSCEGESYSVNSSFKATYEPGELDPRVNYF